MPRLRVHNVALSLDGYGAGPSQSVDAPLGVGGEALHQWAIATRAWRAAHGESGGDSDPVDERLIALGEENVGATVMGRNMFGPVRGPWDEPWDGWWGEDPPFHHPVFVLTHHPRPPLEMAGGTTFHFVTDGISAALSRAFDAAGGRDVRLGGGMSTIQQYLRAGLVDDLNVAVVPVFLGAGERLFDDVEGMPSYDGAEVAAGASVAHYRLVRRTDGSDRGV
jgi:dihydrofolate reductase